MSDTFNQPNTPGGAPPFGDVSPVDANESRQGQIIACSLVMMYTAALTVGLRLYTRYEIVKRVGWDDWLVLGAFLFSVGVSIGQIRQTFFALGRHNFTVSPSDNRSFLIEQWYTFLFYAVSLSFTKMSILVLYMRFIQRGPARTAAWVVFTVVISSDAWAIASQFFTCVPLNAVWDLDVKGKCFGVAVPIANSVLNVVTDVMIFILPMPSLAKLQLPRKQKIGILAVFALGFMVVLTSIIRIIVISTLNFADATFELAKVAYLGSLEVNVAIITACLTTLKPLMARLFPGFMSNMSSRYQTEAHPNRGGLGHPTLPSRARTIIPGVSKANDVLGRPSSFSDDGEVFERDTYRMEVKATSVI